LWERLAREYPRIRDSVFLSGKPDLRYSALIPGSAYSGLLYPNPARSDGAGPGIVEIREELLGITSPDTGQPLFRDVYLGDVIYKGQAAGRAPGLILDAYDSGWNIRTAPYTSHPGRPESGYFYRRAKHRDFGWHSRDGIYIFCGDQIEPNAELGTAHLLDIPATLVHLYGLPIPGDFEGKVLLEVLAPAVRDIPVRILPAAEEEESPASNPYSEADADKLTEQLKALGYLD
jgi:hypothetical protein